MILIRHSEKMGFSMRMSRITFFEHYYDTKWKILNMNNDI